MNPTGFESEQVAVIDHYAKHGDQYERRVLIGLAPKSTRCSGVMIFWHKARHRLAR